MDGVDSLERAAERLLQKTNEILARREEFLEASGNGYNLFSSLSLTHEKFHTRMIASVLAPDARHGLGTLFLRRFLETLKLDEMAKSLPPDSKTITVEVEKSIGPLSSDNETGGIIDIVIETDGLIVVIENKVDEREENNQTKQLYRYKKWLDQQQPIHKLLVYLTPTGKSAPESSTDGNDFKLRAEKDYQCISYDSIGKWIELCIQDSALFPRIRETLVQYRDYLGIRFSIPAFGDKYMNELVDLISKGNFAAAEAIAKEYPKIRQQKVQDLIKKGIQGLDAITGNPLYRKENAEEWKRFADQKSAPCSNAVDLFCYQSSNDKFFISMAWEQGFPGIGIRVDNEEYGNSLLNKFSNMPKNDNPTGWWPYWIRLENFQISGDFFDSDAKIKSFLEEFKGAIHNIINAISNVCIKTKTNSY